MKLINIDNVCRLYLEKYPECASLYFFIITMKIKYGCGLGMVKNEPPFSCGMICDSSHAASEKVRSSTFALILTIACM